MRQIETNYDYGDNAITIEVREFTGSPTDMATVTGPSRPGEYRCPIGELIALMQKTVELYESQYGEA